VATYLIMELKADGIENRRGRREKQGRSTIRSPLLILEFPSSFLRDYLPNEAAGFAALLFCGLWLCEERKGKEGFEKKTFSYSSTGVQYNDTEVHTCTVYY
jgi:hypothetical protein